MSVPSIREGRVDYWNIYPDGRISVHVRIDDAGPRQQVYVDHLSAAALDVLPLVARIIGVALTVEWAYPAPIITLGDCPLGAHAVGVLCEWYAGRLHAGASHG